MKICKTVAICFLLSFFVLLGACSSSQDVGADPERTEQPTEVTVAPVVTETPNVDERPAETPGIEHVNLLSADEQRYAGVLDLYYQALREHQAAATHWDSSNYILNLGLAESIVNPYWSWENAEDVLARIGYAFWDLNQDGANELMLGWIGGSFCPMEDGYVFAVYTLSGSSPILSFQGQERDRFVIGRDGYVYRSGSSGAAYANYEKCQFNTQWQYCLKPMELLYSQVDENNNYWWEYVVGADCIAKTKRYEKHEEYMIDSDYAIRTGEEWISHGVCFKPTSFKEYAAKRF